MGARTAALQSQRNDIDFLQRRLLATVLVVKAFGGGWDAGKLPTTASLPRRPTRRFGRPESRVETPLDLIFLDG